VSASNHQQSDYIDQQLHLASAYENRCACAQGAIGSAAGLIAGLFLHFCIGTELFEGAGVNIAATCAITVFVGTGAGKLIGLGYFRYRARVITDKISALI
jgi:hypothetical protein